MGMLRALALLKATNGVACGSFAGVLYGLDEVRMHGKVVIVPPGGSQRRGVRRSGLQPEEITTVNGLRCTTGPRTLIDLAGSMTDTTWEQALESALRLRVTGLTELEKSLQRRHPGNGRVRRVLAMRPLDAPPTESLLETLAVQLIRDHHLPTPVRQLEVRDRWGQFVARVDLAWPILGVFLELDGQHHQHQPVYDARRETAIVAATGWLPGRFTWTEIRHHRKATARRIADLLKARPFQATH